MRRLKSHGLFALMIAGLVTGAGLKLTEAAKSFRDGPSGPTVPVAIDPAPAAEAALPPDAAAVPTIDLAALEPAADAAAEPAEPATSRLDDAALDRCLIEPVLGSIRALRDDLETRERKATERERLLEAMEARVRDKLDELSRQQAELNALLDSVQAEASEETKRLVAIYENMKPQNAAPIFERMPAAIAAGFVRHMREQQSSLILANMSPDKAYALTMEVANTHVAVRRREGRYDGDATTE